MLDVVYLYEVYHERELSWLSRRLNSPDDVQDVLANAYLHAVQHLQSQPDVKNPAAWFRSLVHNSWIDLLRYRSRDKRDCGLVVELESDEALEWLDTEHLHPDPAEIVLDNEGARHAQVARMLAEMPERDRRIIMMRLDGHRYDVIARALDIAPVTARRIHCQAVQKMRALVKMETQRGGGAGGEGAPLRQIQGGQEGR